MKRKRQEDVPLRRSARLRLSEQTDNVQTPSNSTLIGEPTDLETPGKNYFHDAVQPGKAHIALQKQEQTEVHQPLYNQKHRQISSHSPVSASDPDRTDPIDYWRRSGFIWPRGHWSKDNMNPTGGEHRLARNKSTSTLPRKRSSNELSSQSNQSIDTPSDQKSRQEKSAPYNDPRYESLLATAGSYMDDDLQGIADKSKALCRTLLETSQSPPPDTLFRVGSFEQTLRSLRNRNESRVIYDILQLLVPSAEALAIKGETELDILVQSVNEGWNNSIPVTKPRPQPDFAVGFRDRAFTNEQLKKIAPYVGNIFSQLSLFMATYYLYFPCFACEVKCGSAVLDVADRQNAHSMTVAMRGVVELFRIVGREKELNREILAFSISHSDTIVKLYGHYPVIDGQKTAYYRHTIRTLFLKEELWTSYRFVKNLYLIWMPSHLKRICSAIDDIPANLDFEVSGSALHFTEPSTLSQGLAGYSLVNDADDETTSGNQSQVGLVDTTVDTPDTSFTRSLRQTQSKKQKKKL